MYLTLIKPFFDFFVSLVAVILLSPLYLLVYLLLKFDRTKQPLFYQPRPGKNEQVFHIIKFKTMTDGRDAQGRLLPDDERLTRIGTALRKSSLDEIPQLFNVLNGDMSLVGPRPLRKRYLPYYSERESLRHTVKPGITGLAQVSGRNAIGWDKRLELDAYYAENTSFMLDCRILTKTMVKVFKTSETEFSDEPDSLDVYRNDSLADDIKS